MPLLSYLLYQIIFGYLRHVHNHSELENNSERLVWYPFYATNVIREWNEFEDVIHFNIVYTFC